MKAQIPWLRVFVEGVVIVGSILLAFGIQAWWEARASQLTFELQLESTLAEIEDGQAELVQWASRRRSSVRRTNELATLLASVPSETQLSVPDTLVASLMTSTVIELPTAQVDALLAGGFPALSGNPVRTELTSLRALIEDYRDDEIVARDYIAQELSPYLHANFDVAEAERAWFEWIVMDGAPSGHTDLISTRHLRNLIARKERDLLLLDSQADILLEAMERVAEQVRAVLDP